MLSHWNHQFTTEEYYFNSFHFVSFYWQKERWLSEFAVWILPLNFLWMFPISVNVCETFLEMLVTVMPFYSHPPMSLRDSLGRSCVLKRRKTHWHLSAEFSHLWYDTWSNTYLSLSKIGYGYAKVLKTEDVFIFSSILEGSVRPCTHHAETTLLHFYQLPAQVRASNAYLQCQNNL